MENTKPRLVKTDIHNPENFGKLIFSDINESDSCLEKKRKVLITQLGLKEEGDTSTAIGKQPYLARPSLSLSLSLSLLSLYSFSLYFWNISSQAQGELQVEGLYKNLLCFRWKK